MDQTMTVVQDCTGLYLRIDGDDYRVCNLEKVASYADGATVIASVRHIAECNDSAQNAFACLKLYPSHGWIEVLEIY